MNKFSILIATVFVILTASCSKDDINNISLTETEAKVPGTWHVTYYLDNSDGESNDFDGYTFEFGDDGSVTATTGGTTFNGSWIVKNSDDDPKYDKEIEFTIAGNKQMDELDGSWLITELTDTSMKLKDDSPGEEIHFSK